MDTQEPNYYAIIPASVRYDSELVANAKLLYGEITALCNKQGYCWATNEYFALLYKTSEKTISRWVKNLEEKKYIFTRVMTFRYNDGTVKKVRYIHLDKNSLDHMDKNVPNHMDNFDPDHMDKNVPYNNTDISITNINNTIRKSAKRFTSPTTEEVKTYCLLRNNNVDPERFVDFYASKGWKVGNTPMKDWKAAVRTWEKRDSGNQPAKASSPYSLSADEIADLEAQVNK